jgi:hypothetical protein
MSNAKSTETRQHHAVEGVFCLISVFEMLAFRTLHRDIDVNRASKYRITGVLDGINSFCSVRSGDLFNSNRIRRRNRIEREDTLRGLE